jgi:signal transduction histidine kinase
MNLRSRDKKRAAIAAAVLAVLSIGIVDVLTGPLWSMQIFYLVPVAWVTVLVDRRAGIGLAGACAVSGFLSDVIIPRSADRFVAAVNVFFMFITLLIIVELLHRLRRRADEAAAAEERGGEFLAYAAHQLRTPLAAVGTTSDALMICDDPDTRTDLLVYLRTEVARAARLLQSLLRVARLDQHEPLSLRTTDLRPILIAEAERFTRHDPALDIRVDVTSSEPISIECDPAAIGEAIANLLDNAVRHAHSRVTIRASPSLEAIEISVADDGPGLPPGKADEAFQRFVTLDSSRGSGLGLPIARGIAEAHGGTLSYEGSAFRLRLPAGSQST